ncbi:exopolysaccharide biosynthesis glycosyltransferase VpsK [soil metagenome]
MTTTEFKPQNFCGLPLHGATASELIDWLVAADPVITAPRFAAYLNAHTTNLAHRKNGQMRRAIKDADFVYADGMAVVKAARRRGIQIPERVSAADFFPQFCRAAADRHRTLALIGGAPGLAEKCAVHLAQIAPDIKIVLTHNGYVDDPAQLIEQLKHAKPDIVLLGMGSPQQELLAMRLRDEVGIPTTWCVGALFEYFTPGVRRHAPHWMRKGGLEWLFRLSQEPTRLAGRYLIGNPLFLWRTRKGARWD